MATENKMGVMPLNRLLISMSVPMMISMLVQALYNIVDSIFVSRIDENALTAVSLAFPLQTLMIALGTGTGVGINALLSKSLGEKDFDKADKTAENGVFLALINYVVFCLIGFFLTKPFYLSQTRDPQIIEYGVQYLRIVCCCSFGMYAQFVFERLLQSTGKTVYTMITQSLGAVINIVLDPIFIFGLHMGVRGAALATVISQCCSCIWVISFLFGRRTTLRIRGKNMGLKAAYILPCLALGSAIFIMQGSESIISVCFNSSLLKYGGDIAVGAMTILTSVMQFAMLPLQGLGQGAQPIISYNYGAKNASRVRSAFKLLLKVSLLYSTILWLFIMCFPKVFASIFTTDAALIAFTKDALRYYLAALFMFGIQIACQMTFNALGNAPASILVAIMRKFVLLLPLIFILPHIITADKTMAVYLAEPIADVLAVTFTSILFSFQFKKAIREMEK